MMEFIMVPAILGIITYGVYKLFELFARRKERMAIIEKLDFSKGGLQSPIDLNLGGRDKFNSLKFACLLLGLGAGLLVGFLISINTNLSSIDTYLDNRDMTALVIGSCILLFGGLGLLASFILEQMLGKKK